MPKSNLTDIGVRNIEPPEKGQVTHWDSRLTGFGVRVSQGGAKTFLIMVGKERRRITIGRYPLVSLADARKKGRQLLLGQTLKERGDIEITYDEAVQRFLTQKQGELKESTHWSYTTLLARNFDFKGILVGDIDTGLVLNQIDRIARQSQKVSSFSVIKVFFNWCVERHYIMVSPLLGVKKPKPLSARDRVLNDDELTLIWKGCDKLGKYGAIVQLLILTGQRRNQISRLEQKWINFKKKEIVFPASVMKNNQEHILPIAGLCEFVLRTNVPNDNYYFSPVGLSGHPFTAWSKNKRALDRTIDIDPWTLHDLRRTWSTNAARLDIPPHITDRVLAHSTGSIGPVARVYNRWKYLDEMQDAMGRMNSHIMQLIA